MPGSDGGFSNKVTKALARYQSDVRSQQRFASEDPQSPRRSPTTQPPPSGPDTPQHDGVTVVAGATEGHHQNQINSRHDAAVRGGLQLVDPRGEIATIHPHRRISADATYYGVSAEAPLFPRRPRRNGVARWFMLFMLLAALTGLASWPVDHRLVLPATLTAYGEESTLISPVDGVVRQVSIASEGRVTRGQLLVLIEPDASPQIRELQHQWAALALRDMGLRARLDGEDQLAHPGDLISLLPDVDIGPFLEREQARLTNGLQEDREYDAARQHEIAIAASDLLFKRADLEAVEKRLARTTRQLANAKGLKAQNVVYDNGVYTDALMTRLQKAYRTDAKVQAGLADEEAQIGARLQDLRETLAQAQQQRVVILRRQSEEARTEADAVMTQLQALKSTNTRVDLRAPATGHFALNENTRVGGDVAHGDPIGRLWVPNEEGILEGSVKAAAAGRIHVGQPAEVVLPLAEHDMQMRFRGQVVALINGPQRDTHDTQPHKVRIRIDIPDESGALASPMMPGTPGRVSLDTDGQPLWRYLSVALFGVGGQ